MTLEGRNWRDVCLDHLPQYLLVARAPGRGVDSVSAFPEAAALLLRYQASLLDSTLPFSLLVPKAGTLSRLLDKPSYVALPKGRCQASGAGTRSSARIQKRTFRSVTSLAPCWVLLMHSRQILVTYR